MSEKRSLKVEPVQELIDIPSTNRLRGKMLSQQGLPGRNDLTGTEVTNSDLGTICTMQTRQDVRNTRAIHHEVSNDNTPLPEPVADQQLNNMHRLYVQRELTRSD